MEKDLKTIFSKIANQLKEKGHEYYSKNEKDKTAIFWELEHIVHSVIKEEAKS